MTDQEKQPPVYPSDGSSAYPTAAQEKEALKKKNQSPPGPATGQQPVYFESASPRGWTIVINNRFWTDGFRVFVSRDACDKYEAFKKSSNEHVQDLQNQGIGIPLFKVVNPVFPINSRFLTFRKYTPNAIGGPFDVDRDFHEYCVVKKRYHIGYDSYIFEFHPDPNNPKADFSFVMFSHTSLPINDYIYKGERHRWIDESYIGGFRKRFQVKFGFKHTELRPEQPSLCDNWDGVSDKLDKKKQPNPLLDSFWKNKLNAFSKFAKPEYYGSHCSAILGEYESYFGLGHAEVSIDDVYNSSADIDYESTRSVHEDASVLICVASVLKRQKDIIEDRKKRSSN
ncbi:uncharacterized protein LODBEIA_P51430 [Lodderomyces beijingensis]|uniref:Uncharacterized protein n=1 Tax=Lodderomyces beijingensis TaxID=1775926 RepID=A0ABP0ZRZ6_9ASCO